MIDSDNVLLLRPAFPNSGFCLEHASRPTPGSRGQVAGLLVATIYHLGTMAGAAFAEFFARNLQSILTEAGVSVLASFVTETHSNTFPALPVREDANVFIWFSSVANGAIHEQRKTRIAALLRQKKPAGQLANLVGSSEELLLSPTTRSLLRGKAFGSLSKNQI